MDRSDFYIIKKLCIVNTSEQFNEGDTVKVKLAKVHLVGEIVFIRENTIEIQTDNGINEILWFDDICEIEHSDY